MRSRFAFLSTALATVFLLVPTTAAQASLVDLGPLGEFPIVNTSGSGSDGDEDRPIVATLAATGVTRDSATLHGTVNPNDRETNYKFEYGTSIAYGTYTAVGYAGEEEQPVPVSAVLTGLQPGTTYHFRVVATSDKGTSRGADMSFSTEADPPPPDDPPPPPPADDPPADDPPPPPPADDPPADDPPADDPPADDPPPPAPPAGDTPRPADTPPSPDPSGLDTGSPAGDPETDAIGGAVTDPAPELGREVTTAPESGTVRVDTPGAGGFRRLDEGVAVPVGSVVDATAGTVEITTELDSGRTQSATFWGGIFKVRQRADEGGLTEIVLRGPAPDCSGSSVTGKKKLSSAKRKVKRKRGGLWGRDSKGRWRTRGRGSQATTRGTRWYTEDRCDGTYTRVTEGAVEVEDFRTKRSVLVRAGRSYLARKRAARR